jgi:hypothetical protein
MAINLETFAKDLTYQADTSVRQIFKDLKEIAEIKQLAEQKIAYFSSWGRWVAVYNIFVMLVSFSAVTNFSSDGRSGRFIIMMFVIVILVSPTIFYYAKLSCYNKWKLRDDRCELPKKILSMVNRDLAPNSNVKILIDFTPVGKMGKRIQTLPHPDPGKIGWNLEIFEDQWLTLEGKFIDSSNFCLTVTDLNRKASWVNRRGRFKSKYKDKGTDINLRLTFPSKKYGATSFLQQATQSAVKLPAGTGVQLKQIKVAGKAIDLTVNTPQNLNQEEMYQTITMMFLSLYQILNFAKMLSKRRAA